MDFFLLGGFEMIDSLKVLLILSYDEFDKSNIAGQNVPKCRILWTWERFRNFRFFPPAEIVI